MDNASEVKNGLTSDSRQPSNNQVIQAICDYIRRVAEEGICPRLQGITDLISTSKKQGVQEEPGTLSQTDEAKQIQGLMNQIDFLEAQNRSLTHADEERSKAVQKVKELELKNKKLHQIILENGGGVVGPPEEEVLAKFRELNQIINRMIHKYYSGATGCRINTAKEPQPSKAFWDMMSKDLVGAKKTLWFRALVANLIYEQLFHPDYPIFGLDSADIPQESEHCMVSVEKQLVKSKKVPNADIVEWRSRTVSAGLSLDRGTFFEKSTFRAICDDLSLFSRGLTNTDRDKIHAAVKEIALKAVELALLLRASKVGYSWEQIPYKTPFNPTEMEIMESLDEASISDPSMTRVAFTVFGSVVKTGGITEGERVVLQKAEVVVKKM